MVSAMHKPLPSARIAGVGLAALLLLAGLRCAGDSRCDPGRRRRARHRRRPPRADRRRPDNRAGRHERVISRDDTGRTDAYRASVRPRVRHADGAVPLLVALHGGTGSGRQFERQSNFDGIVEANHFLVVYPDGIGSGAARISYGRGTGASAAAPR